MPTFLLARGCIEIRMPLFLVRTGLSIFRRSYYEINRHLAFLMLSMATHTMIAIERLFENHLAGREISFEELRQFGEDHVGKLKALPALPAELQALLVPTEAAFDAYDGDLSARTTLLAVLGGGTISKNDAMELIRTTVRQREGRVRDKFPKGSAAYAEFYPQGLNEYNKARLGQIPGLLTRLIAAATKYQAELGPELLAEFQALQTTFDNARDGQVEAKGDLAQARADLAASREALELRLGKNILAVASHHLGDPAAATTYFNQSLLEDPDRSADPVEP